MSVLTEEMRQRIQACIARYPSKQAVTLPALHIVQDELRHVPLAAIEEIAEMLDLQPAQVHDTLSFYGFFRDEKNPLGKHRVWVCRSISCWLRGGEELLANLCGRLGVKPWETTPDGRVTLEFAECLGACEGAPCMLVNEELEANLTAEQTERRLQGLN